MKRKKADKLEMLFLILIAIAGIVYVCKKEKDFDKRMEELQKCEPISYRAIEMDGKKILIPIK